MKRNYPITSKVDEYAEGVRSGRIVACHRIRQAVDRWYADQKRDDLYFDETDFVLIVNVAHNLRHFKGDYAGKPLDLEPWQLFILANILGWKRKATKKRRYTYADVYVPRKNGKTTIAGLLALYFLIFDRENAAEVYAAAVDKEQAKICFETSKELITRSEFSGEVDVYRGSIVYRPTASSYKPLTKDTKNKDGLNPSCAICDERHAWATNEIYDVIKTGMGARSQPMLFSISTAGTDTSVPYFSDLEFLRGVLDGIHEKDNHFIMLFEPDDGDSWGDPAVWRKVNPNYGVSLSQEYFESEFREAKMKGGTTLAAFCTKNLNMWVDAPDVWIPDDDVKACTATFDEEQLRGADCYVGIDYASKTDICAVAFWFPAYHVAKFLFMVPSEKVAADSGDRVDYRKWQEEGLLTVIQGKVIDEDWFVETVTREMQNYRVKAIAYDPWGMWNVIPRFPASYQDCLMEYQQSIKYMSVPTKELEKMVLKHDINFLGNPIIRWMFANVVIWVDPNANIKLNKGKSRNKIDGVVALVDAFGAWLNKTSGDDGQIYASHSLRTISI